MSYWIPFLVSIYYKGYSAHHWMLKLHSTNPEKISDILIGFCGNLWSHMSKKYRIKCKMLITSMICSELRAINSHFPILYFNILFCLMGNHFSNLIQNLWKVLGFTQLFKPSITMASEPLSEWIFSKWYQVGPKYPLTLKARKWKQSLQTIWFVFSNSVRVNSVQLICETLRPF